MKEKDYNFLESHLQEIKERQGEFLQEILNLRKMMLQLQKMLKVPPYLLGEGVVEEGLEDKTGEIEYLGFKVLLQKKESE